MAESTLSEDLGLSAVEGRQDAFALQLQRQSSSRFSEILNTLAAILIGVFTAAASKRYLSLPRPIATLLAISSFLLARHNTH
jgi:hypothetical protein